MTKKEKERHILEMVYEEDRFESIEPSERPDFLLKHRGGKERFGVEITEFYFTESDARLKNIPGYTLDLIDHKKYRHKEDKGILQVGEIKIIRPEDDSVVDVTDAVIRDNLPSVSEYVRMIAERIEQKARKHKDYCDGLSHVNLIIFDGENRLSTIDPSEFHKYFYTSDLA